jgi:hypothetical protein
MALSNIRQRYELAYGSRASMEVSQDGGAYTVSLRFPADEGGE